MPVFEQADIRAQCCTPLLSITKVETEQQGKEKRRLAKLLRCFDPAFYRYRFYLLILLQVLKPVRVDRVIYINEFVVMFLAYPHILHEFPVYQAVIRFPYHLENMR